MQTEEREETSSAMIMDPWSLFLYGMKAPMTREKYRGRLAKFFNFIGLAEGTIEERAKTFTERGKRQPDWVFQSVLRFAQAQKERVANEEISPATLRNYIKAVKLFCEMNDIVVTWRKITRGLPKAGRFADDRAPTLDEIREILDAADLRGKALTLIFTRGGIREGAIPYLRVSDYSLVKKEGHLLAGRLQVHSGDPESYVTFITPEACIAIDKYLDFRRQHGEEISPFSPLFCEKFDPVTRLDEQLNDGR